MSNVDFVTIRGSLGSLDAASAHTASGTTRPKVEEIFAPDQHAGALDPNVTIVLGARGAGKSFWAGVLGDNETRMAAAEAYPRIGLDKLSVRFGFTGLPGDGSVSRATIDSLVPTGRESTLGVLLWRCVVLRALQSALHESKALPTISAMMKKYADPELWERDCANADLRYAKRGKVLVVFDALDALAVEWDRLRNLTDALLEVAWSTRGYAALRVKLFLRPDQIRDLGLRFVELPKLRAGATNLRWSGVDLYGMLFARLAGTKENEARGAFNALLREEGIAPLPGSLKGLRSWPLTHERIVQANVFTRLAGPYMGRGHKKGRTYDWPVRHLADGHGEVTPRSFLSLMIEAARYPQLLPAQAITAEGIRHGLREASRTRVNQLELEFPWIKRVLAPLARLQVPCDLSLLLDRWDETQTVTAVLRQALERSFLPPSDPKGEARPDRQLIATLARIGVLILRADGRIDMPDLFRVAARLLKKGGVTPS